MSYSYSSNNSGELKLKEMLKKMQNMYVKVGFPKESTPAAGSNKGSGHEPAKDIATLALIAATQEFGTTKAGKGNTVTIPARPFMEPGLRDNKEKLSTLIKKTSKEALEGKRTLESCLALSGELIVNGIKKAINETTDPPNYKGALQSKGSTHPLIDTAQMRNSVTYVIMTGTEKETPVDKKSERA